MNYTVVKGAVEAVLFAMGEPISAGRIAEAVGIDVELTQKILLNIKDELDDNHRGICLLRFDDRYQLATAPVHAEAVQKALDTRRNTPLSQAALEVLAIIAYNQPVSRSFIDQIRGVDSSSSIQTLITKNLVCEAGRLDLPGRPISFQTTDTFLRCFGLESLDGLPPVYTEQTEPDDLQEGEPVLLLAPEPVLQLKREEMVFD